MTLVPETLARYDFKKNRYDFTDSTDKTLKRKKNFKRSFNTFLQAFELILFWYKRFLDSFKKVNLERMNHLKHKLMTTRYQKALSKQKKYQTFLRLLFCISANRKFIRNPVILKNSGLKNLDGRIQKTTNYSRKFIFPSIMCWMEISLSGKIK